MYFRQNDLISPLLLHQALNPQQNFLDFQQRIRICLRTVLPRLGLLKRIALRHHIQAKGLRVYNADQTHLTHFIGRTASRFNPQQRQIKGTQNWPCNEKTGDYFVALILLSFSPKRVVAHLLPHK